MSAWEKEFIKNWPSFALVDWTKITNEQKPLKQRNLEKIIKKRFENVFVEIDEKLLLGGGHHYFKTAVAITQFGLAFINTGPALILGRHMPIGEMLFWNKEAFEKYKEWNINNKYYWELKAIIVNTEIKKELGVNCIVVDYLNYSLFSFPFGRGAKKRGYLFLENYKRLFDEIKSKINFPN